MSLAIFRIVFCATLFSQITWKHLLFYSQLPDALRIPPVGLEWLVPYIPINPTLGTIAAILFYFFAFTGMIGLYSRTSAFMIFILGFYALGIERFFGDVSHRHHHILWFSLILSFSRCGDALAIDSWKKSYKPSTTYTIPIRILWILIGILYFFPGFWKIYFSGWDWALGDNMKYQMYGKWFWREWTPFFRIDHYPILYKLGGLGTLIFEAGFIFFIFFPYLRIIPIVLGIGFHTMTHFFLHVSFWSLTFCYVVFFDWHAIFNRLRMVSKKAASLLTPPPNNPLLFVVAPLMISINLYLGFTHTLFSWPFACYPTFRAIRGPQRTTKEMKFLDQDRQPIILDRYTNSKKYGGGKRLRSLVTKILQTEDPELRIHRLRGLLAYWGELDPHIKDTAYIQIYRTNHWVEPDKLKENPISSKLHEEIAL